MKKDKLRVLLNVIIVISFLSMIFSTVYNTYIIKTSLINSNKFKSDYKVVRVVNIDYMDNVYLDNGEMIKGGDIKNSAKLFKGEGTWYSEEDNCLLVEMTNNDLKDMVIPVFCYLVSSIICFFLYKKNDCKGSSLYIFSLLILTVILGLGNLLFIMLYF